MIVAPFENGWWPRLSWPWVVAGAGTVTLWNVETGEVRVLAEGYPSGWFHATTVEWREGSNDVQRRCQASAPDWQRVVVEENLPGANWHAASRGHCAAMRASMPPHVWYDGVEIPNPPELWGYGCLLDGTVLAQAHRDTNRWSIFDDGVLREVRQAQSWVHEGTLTAPGWIGYGYAQHPRLLAPDGRDLDVTVTPNGSGGPPLVRILDGVPWCWSCTEPWGIVGYPLGETACLVTGQIAVALDVQLVGRSWIVAGCNDKGALTVAIVDVDAPRQILVLPDPVLPVVPDLTGRKLWLGYFFAISDRPGPDYGDNLAAPGNCTLVITEAEAARSPWPYFAPVGIADGPRKIADWTSTPDAACTGLHILDDGHAVPRDPVAGARWQGLECYADWHGETAADVRRRVSAWLDRHRVPTILIGQAYDRNGNETRRQVLADLQAVPLHLAHEFPHVEGVLWFSDGRAGGTRSHRDGALWRQVHARAAAQVVTPDVTPPAPLACTIDWYRPAQGPASLTVEAQGSGTGDLQEWSWRLQGGLWQAKADDWHTTITLEEPGTYELKLTTYRGNETARTGRLRLIVVDPPVTPVPPPEPDPDPVPAPGPPSWPAPPDGFLRGLVAGFGDPLGAPLLAELVDRGVQLVRDDLQLVRDRATFDARVMEFVESPAPWPLFIVTADQVAWLPRGCWAELRNEPDFETSPAAYAEECRLALHAAARGGLTLWCGAVSNLDQDSLAWLEALLHLCPEIPRVSVHRYSPTKTQGLWSPHNGFRDRHAELRRLFGILAGRPYLVTEIGYHVGQGGLSEADQAEHLRAELQYWRAAQAAGICLYQLNDGLSNEPIDRYGLRRSDGTWRPSGDIFQESP